MMGFAELLAAIRQVLVPVNIVMALLFAAGVALLALGTLQLLWREEAPPAGEGGSRGEGDTY